MRRSLNRGESDHRRAEDRPPSRTARRLRGSASQAPAVEPQTAKIEGQPDVLRDVNAGNQPQILEDHADPAARAAAGDATSDASPVDLHPCPSRAGARHRRASSTCSYRSVLAEHRVHLAHGHIEVDVVVGDHVTDAFVIPRTRSRGAVSVVVMTGRSRS